MAQTRPARPVEGGGCRGPPAPRCSIRKLRRGPSGLGDFARASHLPALRSRCPTGVGPSSPSSLSPGLREAGEGEAPRPQQASLPSRRRFWGEGQGAESGQPERFGNKRGAGRTCHPQAGGRASPPPGLGFFPWKPGRGSHGQRGPLEEGWDGGQSGRVGGKRGPHEPLCTAPSLVPHPGTEFDYTDSEGEVKVRKRSPAGLLRPKKGLGEPGPSLAAPMPGPRGPGPASPDKAKLAAEKGRKARKLRGPKEAGFEAGPEASDDDLWARRRSERIFLHDASAAAPAPSSAAPAVTKPSRCGKGGPLSPRKDAGRAKDRKDPRKVGARHQWATGRDPGHQAPPPAWQGGSSIHRRVRGSVLTGGVLGPGVGKSQVPLPWRLFCPRPQNSTVNARDSLGPWGNAAAGRGRGNAAVCVSLRGASDKGPAAAWRAPSF